MEHQKTRIGVIYPSDGVLDDEFWRCVPPSVTVHVTRTMSSLDVPGGGSYEEAHGRTAEGPYIDQAAASFVLIEPAAVAYACTAVSFAKGVGYDEVLCRRINAASGSPATTTTSAMVAALRAFGARRVAVAAPYLDAVCERLQRFLRDSGFDVVSLANLNLKGMEITRVTPDEVYALGKRADRAEADVLFLSCTNLRTLEVLEPLERDLGKPVMSSNLVTMWQALRLAGLTPRLDGLGALYRRCAP
jgi:maleate isomerase